MASDGCGDDGFWWHCSLWHQNLPQCDAPYCVGIPMRRTRSWKRGSARQVSLRKDHALRYTKIASCSLKDSSNQANVCSLSPSASKAITIQKAPECDLLDCSIDCFRSAKASPFLPATA